MFRAACRFIVHPSSRSASTYLGPGPPLHPVRFPLDELPPDARAASEGRRPSVGHVLGRGERLRIVPHLRVGGAALSLLVHAARDGLPVDGKRRVRVTESERELLGKRYPRIVSGLSWCLWRAEPWRRQKRSREACRKFIGRPAAVEPYGPQVERRLPVHRKRMGERAAPKQVLPTCRIQLMMFVVSGTLVSAQRFRESSRKFIGRPCAVGP